MLAPRRVYHIDRAWRGIFDPTEVVDKVRSTLKRNEAVFLVLALAWPDFLSRRWVIGLERSYGERR